MHRSRPGRHAPAAVAARAALLCAAALTAACGGTSIAKSTAPPRARDTRFVEHDRGVYSPAPGGAAPHSGALALRSDGAGESARRVALQVAQALLDADAVTLQRLFAERVVFGGEGFGRPGPELVERCIEETRSLAYEPDLRLEDVIDVRGIEVRRAAQLKERTALPPGIEPADLLVTLPPRAEGGRARARIACASALYVRLGARAQVVGLLR